MNPQGQSHTEESRIRVLPQHIEKRRMVGGFCLVRVGNFDAFKEPFPFAQSAHRGTCREHR